MTLTGAGVYGVLQSRGAAVLRLRRLRAHRDSRRGGRRPGAHDPEGHPARAGHHARGLRPRRDQRARGRRAGLLSPAPPRRSPPRCAPATSTRSRPPCASAADRRPRCPAVAHRRRQPHRVRHGRRRRAPAMARCRPPHAPVPHRAEVVIGGLVAVWSSLTDVRRAIGFSSFCVLTYYAIANAVGLDAPARAASLAARPRRRRRRRLRHARLHPARRHRVDRRVRPRRRRRVPGGTN